MRSRLVLVLLLASCGRLQFGEIPDDAGTSGDDGAIDARVCVAVGHDEDADGVDDACDLCPQRADNDLDSDGDGVGDVCDVSSQAQTRVVFDPMTELRPEVWAMTQGTYVGDAMRFDTLGGGAGALMTGVPGTETFEITGNLIAASATQAQFTLSINNGLGHYYCELYDEGTGVELQLTYTLDEVTYMNLGTTLLPGRFDSGPFRLILDHTPPMTTCYGEWKGARAMVSGMNPAVTPATVGISMFQVQADVTSLIRLSTP